MKTITIVIVKEVADRQQAEQVAAAVKTKIAEAEGEIRSINYQEDLSTD